MKTIPNLIFTVKGEKDELLTAAKLLKVCLENPPAAGFDFASMRARNRIMDTVDSAEDGGTINLEDADFSVAVESVKAMKWPRMHKDLLKFAELFGL